MKFVAKYGILILSGTAGVRGPNFRVLGRKYNENEDAICVETISEKPCDHRDPVALQNMLTTTGSMVDTIMIAPLGETTVGAVALCAQFSSLMFAGYWGFIRRRHAVFSRSIGGAQDDDGIDHSYGLTLTCMMIVGLTFGVFAIFAPETVMKLYTDKESIQVIGAEYLRIIGFGYPVQVFSMAMSALLRSTGACASRCLRQSPRWHRIFFLNWVFIYGKFGLPEMGVRGAALATSLAAVINVLVILILARAQKYRICSTLKAFPLE